MRARAVLLLLLCVLLLRRRRPSEIRHVRTNAVSGCFIGQGIDCKPGQEAGERGEGAAVSSARAGGGGWW